MLARGWVKAKCGGILYGYNFIHLVIKYSYNQIIFITNLLFIYRHFYSICLIWGCMRNRVKTWQKETIMCSQESIDNFQKIFLDSSRRFIWYITYRIKYLWKSFQKVSHIRQSELKRRSYDVLKIVAQRRRTWSFWASWHPKIEPHLYDIITLWKFYFDLRTINISLEPMKYKP